MSQNIEQFGLYTIKIFDLLYESFPIYSRLNREEIIKDYLSFNKHEELEKAKLKIEASSILQLSQDVELINKVNSILPTIERRKEELENEKRTDYHAQLKIYEGTIEFLLSENFIRKNDSGQYQLTSESFSHLNKIFNNGVISEKNSSLISSIKSALISSSIEVAKSVAINVISSLASKS